MYHLQFLISMKLYDLSSRRKCSRCIRHTTFIHLPHRGNEQAEALHSYSAKTTTGRPLVTAPRTQQSGNVRLRRHTFAREPINALSIYHQSSGAIYLNQTLLDTLTGAAAARQRPFTPRHSEIPTQRPHSARHSCASHSI